MKVLFLQNNGINESLALCEASAALLRAGHHTRLLLEREEPKLERIIRDYAPDLVVIAVGLGLEEWPSAVAARVRAVSQAPLVCGGTSPTVLPQLYARPPFAAVIVGEADETLVDLADAVAAGDGFDDIEGLCLPCPDGGLRHTPTRPLLEDLDSLPLPDRALYYHYGFIRQLSIKRLITGRGCVHRCTYCTTDALRGIYQGHGRFLRRKSPARVIAELQALRTMGPLRLAHFSDDLFVTRRDWLEEFSERYQREIRLPFTCNSSVHLLRPELVPILASAGCVGVAIGVETGREDLREKVLRKPVSNARIEELARSVHAHGMRLATFNMLAIPGASLEDDLGTVAFNQTIGADLVRVNRAMPTPGTAFAELEGWPPGDPRRFRLEPARARLLLLFRLAVMLGLSSTTIQRLLRVPLAALEPLLMLASPFGEMRFYRVGLLEGLRYWLHTGDPASRSTNSHQII